MLASKMVEALQRAIAMYGDLDVVIDPVFESQVRRFVTSEGISPMSAVPDGDMLYEIADDARLPQAVTVLYVW